MEPRLERDRYLKSMSNHIAGKVVVVLDAANEVGGAIARRLSEEGAILVLGSRDETSSKELTRELTWDGGRALAVKTDMTESPQVTRLVGVAAEMFGQVDVMINNPSLSLSEFLLLAGGSDARPDVLAGVHALGAIHGVSAAFSRMRAQRVGHIINVVPTIAATGGIDRHGSDAIRQALSRLSACLRVQAEPYGIRTTLVAASTMSAYPVWTALSNPSMSVARAVQFAIDQPGDMDVNEILFRHLRTDTAAYETTV